MTTNLFSFEKFREFVNKELKNVLNNNITYNQFIDISIIQSINEQDRKIVLDQCFRDIFQAYIKNESSMEIYFKFLELVICSAKQDLCSASTLFLMLSDLFDMSILSQSDLIFKFVEDRVETWKMEIFYNAGKNYLLRMCNDLLRRLSKSQNTVFAGRIQLFLARLFPLEEKSGLNLMSNFNLDNVTIYNLKPDESFMDINPVLKLEETENSEDSEEIKSSPIDFNLYRKFWSIQDFFRRPVQCYEKFAWKTFVNYSDDILNCLLSYQLDETNIIKNSDDRQPILHHQHQQSHFAKYLTSEKLLDLQLSDSNFRRNVLIQFLILFQYLKSPIKFKAPNHILADDQSLWIKETSDKVYNILLQTPPDAEAFVQSVKQILEDESKWSAWKNDGCSNFIRKKDEGNTKIIPMTRGKKRSIGEDILLNGNKHMKLGNPELTRLWNLYPDNLQACSMSQRNYVMGLDEFFEPAIQQNDPKSGIESQYKLINDATYCWKALRLLAQKSSHFFTQQQANNNINHIKTTPQYLQYILNKMSKEIMVSTSDTDIKKIEDGFRETESLNENHIKEDDQMASKDLKNNQNEELASEHDEDNDDINVKGSNVNQLDEESKSLDSEVDEQNSQNLLGEEKIYEKMKEKDEEYENHFNEKIK